MIHSFVFTDGKLVGRDLDAEALRVARSQAGSIVWVDLDNPTEGETKDILEKIFHFHPLAIEDCVAPNSLPKVENYDDYLFIVTHAVDYTRTEKFATTELDLFLGKDYLVTFHPTKLRSTTSAIERLTKATGDIAHGPDRLAHTLLDFMIDNYQPVIDEIGAELEELEETVLGKPSHQGLVAELLSVRSDISHLRHIARPQREVLERLARGDSELICPLMAPYYRNLRDNLVRLEDTASSYHERLLMAFDIYLNKAAFEANEGIKFLTALTAMTIPVMTIGTWYGMNFELIPELKSPHGYLYAVLGTIVTTAAMAIYLKKKKWF